VEAVSPISTAKQEMNNTNQLVVTKLQHQLQLNEPTVQAITSACHRRGITIITVQQAMTAMENRNKNNQAAIKL